MTEPGPPSERPAENPDISPDVPETDVFPDTWDEAPERSGDAEPRSPGDPAPAIPSQPPL